jgi:uncharacterized OsmC-like protein
VSVETNGTQRSVSIPQKDGAPGSSVNGGELLFLALATCYCNDLYREAKKRDITVDGVDVSVTGEFGGEGEPAKRIAYQVSVTSDAPREQIEDLIRHTDTVAEVHNTLREGRPVELTVVEM